MAFPPRSMADAELEVVIAACRWPRSPAHLAVVAAALARPLNWQRLTALTNRHRVPGLVYDALHRIGTDKNVLLDSGLFSLTQRAKVESLAMSAETARLQAQFEAARVPALILKGTAIGALAYGDATIKQSWDIDLLTRPETALAAKRLLSELGYTMSHPASFDEAQFETFVRFAKEATFVNAAGVPVELHWRLIDSPSSLGRADPFERPRDVDIPGGKVRTLEDHLQLAYLAYHGQSHGWSRLKSIADVNGFLFAQPAGRLMAMRESAAAIGARNFVDSAIWLCQDLLGFEPDTALLAEFRARAVLRGTLAFNRKCVSDLVGGGEIPFYSGLNLSMVATTLRNAPDWRSRWEILRTHWQHPIGLSLRKPGFVAGYSLRRFLGLMIRLPRRMIDGRTQYRAAVSRLEEN